MLLSKIEVVEKVGDDQRPKFYHASQNFHEKTKTKCENIAFSTYKLGLLFPFRTSPAASTFSNAPVVPPARDPARLGRAGAPPKRV